MDWEGTRPGKRGGQGCVVFLSLLIDLCFSIYILNYKENIKNVFLKKCTFK